MKSNVVIVGSGAVGLLYGGRLLQSELSNVASTQLNVQFICRRDYNQLYNYGFNIKSAHGDFKFISPIMSSKFHKTVDTLQHKNEIDWIILAVKSYALEDPDLRNLVRSLVSKSKPTRILALMNGIGCEQTISDFYPKEYIFGGMAFVCVNRVNSENAIANAIVNRKDRKPNVADSVGPVLIDHIAYGNLLVGHINDDQMELSLAKKLWDGTIIANDVKSTDSLMQSRWAKLCWNIPFSGLSVALGGVTTDIIKDDPSLRVYANNIMVDTIRLANRHLKAHYKSHEVESGILLDMESSCKSMWHLTDSMGPYKTSAAIDLANSNQIEMKYLFDNVLTKAIEYSMATNLASNTSDIPKNSDVYNIDTSNSIDQIFTTDFPYLESVIRSVQGIGRLAELKRRKGEPWQPIMFT